MRNLKMIKVTCTSGKIEVFPKTGVVTPNGINLPLVAPKSDENVELSEGETMEVNGVYCPAIGGNGGEFVVGNNSESEVTMIRWHELDNDPIYADSMQGYKDLNGDHTDENYSEFAIEAGGSYSDTTIRSNVITLTMIQIGATIQPV